MNDLESQHSIEADGARHIVGGQRDSTDALDHRGNAPLRDPFGANAPVLPENSHGSLYQRAVGWGTELAPEVRQYIEQHFFNYADNIASIALDRHLSRGSWSVELVSAWSRFVIGIHLRHLIPFPNSAPPLSRFGMAVARLRSAPNEAIRKPDDPATFDQFLEMRDPLIAAKMRMNMMIRGFDNEILGAHVNGMTWGVLDVSPSSILLSLSDRPVEFSNLKEPRGFVSLPISPIKLFVAANSAAGVAKLRRIKPREIVQHVNLFVVGRARRFVWAHDELQARFIQNHMSRTWSARRSFQALASIR